jgi:hypothetical protein
MTTKITAAALATVALMAVPTFLPAEVLGENDFQVTAGYPKILSRWRLTYSTDPYTDSSFYGFMGAKVNYNYWSSVSINSASSVAQVLNCYCYAEDYSFTGDTGAG